MKKLISLLVLVLVAASFTGCARTLKTCDAKDLDGTVVCYDEKLEQYAIEEGATLVVNVDNDALGNAIVALWDDAHPEHAGKVSFVNVGAQGATDKLATQTTEFPDVSMAIDGEVSRNLTHMLPFDSVLANLAKANAIESFFDAGNSTDVTVYVPVTFDGMAFIWNKTMLETLGLSTTDADGDNLPDAFDTWEEIFALGTTWKTTRPTYNGNPIKTVYPLSLGEVWSGYSTLTSAGWQIFATGDATKPGYDDPKFKAAFEFLLAAKEAAIDTNDAGEVLAASNMGWRWGDMFNNQSAPFGLVGTWDNIKGASETNNVDYIVSAMPTYKGNQLTPFVKSKGWIINAYTSYQSASHELVRLIYSKAGFQAMVDSSTYGPLLKDDSSLMPEMDETSYNVQMMKAFKYNTPEPLYTFPKNQTKKGMDSVYYPFMSNVLSQIWDGTKTVDEAIAELIELSDAAIAVDNAS